MIYEKLHQRLAGSELFIKIFLDSINDIVLSLVVTTNNQFVYIYSCYIFNFVKLTKISMDINNESKLLIFLFDKIPFNSLN